MGLLDGLKGALFTDDDPRSKAAAPAVATNDRPFTTMPPVGNVAGAPAPVAMPDNEFVTALRNAIKARNTAFTSLLANADKLVKVIPDPAMRLQAAFEMIKGDGRGKVDVMSAIDVHTADLQAARLQFDSALERQKTAALGSTQAELDALAPSTSQARAQIEALQAQITTLNETITRNATRSGELQVKLQTDGSAFALKAQQFEGALQLVKGELDHQKAIVGSTIS